MPKAKRKFNSEYSNEYLDRIAFPMGGMGAGMICLEGTAALSHFSLRHHPDVFNEPITFSALCIEGKRNIAKIIEGPVPKWKIFGTSAAAAGSGHSSFGLPRFSRAAFSVRFPFAKIKLNDNQVPVKTTVVGWSPFGPGDADSSSLPVAALEYTFRNTTKKTINAVYSFNSTNFMAHDRNSGEIQSFENGFILKCCGSKEKPWDQGAFCAFADGGNAKVNHAWFRSGWFDSLTMTWRDLEQGKCFERSPLNEGDPAPGASLFVPFRLSPGEERTIKLLLAWYVPQSNLRQGKDSQTECCDGAAGCCGNSGETKSTTYMPWYAGKFHGVEEVALYWKSNYGPLREASRRFSECFYSSSLPGEVMEAVAANLSILKSPTVLRQADGRLWAWEGCNDSAGCCEGSCTHVWNYAQALPHLFPDLERSLRETEFNDTQNMTGHQNFRAPLPIRAANHDFHAAADGQLGGTMKVYREWRISGDTEWLNRLWGKAKASLDYCIHTWDPDREGVLREPHHNTYDIEFWGPDGMCTSFYLGALYAVVKMGEALRIDVSLYQELFNKGRAYIEKKLFNGEYFFQKVEWKNLRQKNPAELKSFSGKYSTEGLRVLLKEGPKYQYGKGCLSDGVIGAWMGLVCGLDEFLSPAKVKKHLRAVYQYNFKKDLSNHANPQRPTYALGNEGGLLLCSWPKGNRPSLPFVYSDEVWTGIEYQVASHLIIMGEIKKGLSIVRACRGRYDGRTRNPFDEYECGHWYARAMASYALLQSLSGARYDAVDKMLYLSPAIKGDFKCFLCTQTGFGIVGIRKGKPFLHVKQGKIEVRKIVLKK